MSWSLQIEHGDLSIGGNGLNVVTGPAKMVQDLACDILEPMGTDPLHPTFGSVIDGGVDASGTYQPGVIGGYNDEEAAIFIASEIRRICTNYQAAQIIRNQADVAIYGKSTLTANEALLAVTGIQVQQVADHALVTANIQSGAGAIPLAIPVSAS